MEMQGAGAEGSELLDGAERSGRGTRSSLPTDPLRQLGDPARPRVAPACRAARSPYTNLLLSSYAAVQRKRVRLLSPGVINIIGKGFRSKSPFL